VPLEARELQVFKQLAGSLARLFGCHRIAVVRNERIRVPLWGRVGFQCGFGVDGRNGGEGLLGTEGRDEG
jgi:hypothetical protein